MAQIPLNADGGRAPYLGARLLQDDADWINALIERSGVGKGELVRRLIAVARKHEEEVRDAAS
jgi:hypothetical protein